MKKLFLILGFFTLLFFVYWHFYLGIHRYFDIDEYAHLHWAFNAFSGLKPYSQFLYFFPPLFLYLLSSVFLVAGKTFAAYTVARLLIFVIFLSLLGVVFLIVKRMRNTQTALLSIVTLSFLPLPFDKLLEIRPDLPATVLSLLGTYFLMDIEKKRSHILISGFFYGLAMALVPKVFFFLPFALLIVILHGVGSKKLICSLRRFALGMAIPVALTFILFFWSGDISKAIYLTVTFANQSAKLLATQFPMHGSLFFYPNDTYYAQSGVSWPLIANLLIYIIATITVVIRFVSFLDKNTKQESFSELLVSSIFIAGFIAYMKFFPLKHAQYLIVLAPFVAIYFADGAMSIGTVLKRKIGEIGRYIFLIFLLILFCIVGYGMNSVKKDWTNTETFSQIETIKNTIPDDSYVLDLFGESLLYKDPYYLCCIPWGQYASAFSFNLPSLSTALKTTQTKYIYIYNEDRLHILPPLDEKFVREHYSIATANPMILVPGAEFNVSSNQKKSFDLISDGKYTIWLDNSLLTPANFGKITIDGKKVSENPTFLNHGDHTIEVTGGGLVKVQYVPE